MFLVYYHHTIEEVTHVMSFGTIEVAIIFRTG